MTTLIDAIIYSSLLSMMGFGLTMVRRTTGVWNVAQAGLVSIGAYCIFSGVNFLGGAPYIYLPLAFVVGAAVNALLFWFFVNPLRKRGSSFFILLVATIAFNIVLTGIINIYADFLQNVFSFSSKNFLMTQLDLHFLGESAIFFVSLVSLILLTVILFLFLNYTRVGLALRGSIEDPTLSKVMGVQINWIYLLSWAIAGGTAGFAGGLLPMRFQCNPGIGGSLIAVMFSVSILGGVGEIYGPFLGGWLVGFAQIYGINLLARAFGPWVLSYKQLLPMLILVLALLFTPEGLSGFDWTGKLRALITEEGEAR